MILIGTNHTNFKFSHLIWTNHYKFASWVFPDELFAGLVNRICSFILHPRPLFSKFVSTTNTNDALLFVNKWNRKALNFTGNQQRENLLVVKCTPSIPFEKLEPK